jgi:putative iron-regulated protein
MKNIALILIGGACLLATACHKSKDNDATTVTGTQVITDFVQKVNMPQYQDLQTSATALNAAVNTLNTTPTAANLDAARTAWRTVRGSWETCEGFLIGPVEDDNYDPNMDTWPVDYIQLDSFINTSNSFSTATVAALGQSLRGFHPLEFILWGQNGNATVDSISSRDKQYMVALSADILATVTALNNSWAATGGNFQAEVVNAGSGSARFTTRHDAFLAIVAGMSDICDEVGGGKIKEPFDGLDSTKTESPFSHNSMIDFTNNIKGAQNVYLCSYNGVSGASLSTFVSAKNLSLDSKIKQQYAAAISALGNVTVSFETAIHTQRTQLQNAMDAINTLQATLDGDLKTFVTTYVKD